MMTNASVTAVVQTASGQELTLEYSGNTQKILVPVGTPIGTTVPADPSFLKPGEYVFAAAQANAEGKMTVLRLSLIHI